MSTKIENKQADQPLAVSRTNKIKDSQVIVNIDILTISIFFDGTRNNQFNSKAAQDNPALKSKGGSYENYYSNVALIYMATKDTSYHKRIYIEGVGTVRGKSDNTLGLAFGNGKTGLRARIVEACKEIEAIREETEAERLLINLYGFSRGAASARYCCHYLKGRKSIIKSTVAYQPAIHQPFVVHGFFDKTPVIEEVIGEVDKCRFYGIQMDPKNIMINFMGLFDTVSTVGPDPYNDMKDHHFDVGKEYYKIRHIVHLTTENEYRYYFPLTSIKAAIEENIGFECSFPGAHSDVGGGNPDEDKESTTCIGFKRIKGENSDKNSIDWQWFVKMGYYQESQLSEMTCPIHIGCTEVYAKRQVRYHYQFILAEIMADIIKQETTIKFLEKSEMKKRLIEMKAIPILKAFRDVAYAYVLAEYKVAGEYQVPRLDDYQQMKQLYSRYIHNTLFLGNHSLINNIVGLVNIGTPINKNIKPDGTLNFMCPTRTKVTKGYKY